VTDSRAASASAWATYRRLLGYARPYALFTALAMLGMLFDALASGAFTWSLQPMLDDLFDARDPFAIRWLPVFLVGLFLLRGVASFATDYGMARVGRSVVRDLRNAVFQRYQELPASWFDREPSGQIIARITYSAEHHLQCRAGGASRGRCAQGGRPRQLDGARHDRRHGLSERQSDALPVHHDALDRTGLVRGGAAFPSLQPTNPVGGRGSDRHG